MTLLATVFVTFMRFMPAVVLFSLFFSLEGDLRWLGALGVIPLALAFNKGCTSCMTRHGEDPGWHPWAGH